MASSGHDQEDDNQNTDENEDETEYDEVDVEGRGKYNDLQRLLADAITYKASIDDLEVVLKCGGDVNKPVRKGLRPIHYAVYVDYVSAVKFLIENGCDINVRDDVGYTPVHLCARRGNLESMKLLISHGATVSFLDGGDEVADSFKSLGYLTIEPLNLSLENGHVICARLLLDNGATPNNKYFMGYEISLVPMCNMECLELLLQYGATPNVHNRCGLTPLMKACREKEFEVVKLLLNYGADIDMQCSPRFDQKRAIHFAVQSGDLMTTELLLTHGVDTCRPENFKYSPLHVAVTRDRVSLCELLLNYGAIVDERTDEGSTALMLACAAPSLKNLAEIVKLLLERGANPNVHAEFYNYTAPCLAPITEYLVNISEKIEYDVVMTLLRFGGRVAFRNASKLLRMKNPYGILQYINYVKDKPEMFSLLVSASRSYDIEAIHRDRHMDDGLKKVLLPIAANPRPLKQLIRYSLRMVLVPQLPVKVEQLPLPLLLKRYLLFDV